VDSYWHGEELMVALWEVVLAEFDSYCIRLQLVREPCPVLLVADRW
jgi:hypothetical protein